jgi:hypothetical protein
MYHLAVMELLVIISGELFESLMLYFFRGEAVSECEIVE